METTLLINFEFSAENRNLENISVMVLVVVILVFLVRYFTLYKKIQVSPSDLRSIYFYFYIH